MPTVVDGESLHEKGSESGTSSSSEGMADEESLESGALIRQFADTIEDLVDELFADGIMAASVVVRRIFFAYRRSCWRRYSNILLTCGKAVQQHDTKSSTLKMNVLFGSPETFLVMLAIMIMKYRYK